MDEVGCRPGLSDYDMVYAKNTLKSTTQKQKPRRVFLFNKADWPKFKILMKDYQMKFLDSHQGKSVDDLWSVFTSTIDSLATQCARQAHDVNITSPQRRCNVMCIDVEATLYLRHGCIDVEATLYLRHVPTGYTVWQGNQWSR